LDHTHTVIPFKAGVIQKLLSSFTQLVILLVGALSANQFAQAFDTVSFWDKTVAILVLEVYQLVVVNFPPFLSCSLHDRPPNFSHPMHAKPMSFKSFSLFLLNFCGQFFCFCAD